MDDVAFNWFWQPPIDGQPGLIMITDEHPGTEHPEIRFITEAIADVLAHVQARIASDLRLPQFRVYVRDIFGGWFQVTIEPEPKKPYRIHKSKVSQNDLALLWDSRTDATIR